MWLVSRDGLLSRQTTLGHQVEIVGVDGLCCGDRHSHHSDSLAPSHSKVREGLELGRKRYLNIEIEKNWHGHSDRPGPRGAASTCILP